MNLFRLALANLRTKFLSTLLSVLLFTLGTGIISLLLQLGGQFERSVLRHVEGIQLVVGAKGAPTQLILSSVFHLDAPTGNIKLSDAAFLSKNPFVAKVIPVSLGDSYKGIRIVGTDTSWLDLYEAKVAEGRRWQAPLEVVIGAETALRTGLRVGGQFAGSHGLEETELLHDDQLYTVTGILAPTGTVADRLILTATESIWAVHAGHDHGTEAVQDSLTEGHDHSAHEHEHDHDHAHEHEDHAHHDHDAHDEHEAHTEDREVTALLVQYKSPKAGLTIPNMVNKTPHLQAAVPTYELARIFSLLGVGTDLLGYLAWVIMGISGLSVFISLYQSLEDRRYEVALMRVLGASRARVLVSVLLEGQVVAVVGCLAGLLLAHSLTWLISRSAADSWQMALGNGTMAEGEGWLLLFAIVAGLLAALVPAIQAYRLDISQTLAEN